MKELQRHGKSGGLAGLSPEPTARRSLRRPPRRYLLFAMAFILFGFSTAFSQATSSRDPADAALRPQQVEQQANSPEARSPLAELSVRARTVLLDRVMPPVAHQAFLLILLQEQGTLMKEQLIASLESAVDALVNLANTPGGAEAAERALRRLAELRDTYDAKALFARIVERKASTSGATREEEAAAARHLGSLSYLDGTATRSFGALAYMRNPDSTMVDPTMERLKSLAEATNTNRALAAFHRAVELYPEDTWSWIFIARLQGLNGNLTEAESAIKQAIAGAASAGQERERMAALQELGYLYLEEQRFADATQAYEEALAVAQRLAKADLRAAEAQRDLSFGWNGIGEVSLAKGDRPRALDAFQQALEIRKRLAAADPDNKQWQLDLIATHARVALALDNPTAGKLHVDEALSIYDRLASRDRFSPMIQIASSGAFYSYLLLAGTLTLFTGMTLLVRYRRVIARYMKMVSDAPALTPESPAPSPRQAGRRPGEIVLRSLTAAEAATVKKMLQSDLIAGAGRALRRTAWGQVAGGTAFALTAVVLHFLLSDVEPNPANTSVLVWIYSWPAVLTLYMVWGPDRRLLALGLLVYFGIGLALCLRVALGETTPLGFYGITIPPFFQPLLAWVLDAGSTVFLLLFLNRHVRAIGPLLLVFMIIVGFGAHLSMVMLSTYAATKFYGSLLAAIGIASETGMWLVRLVGVAILAPLAWYIMTLIRRRYEMKRLSDQRLVIDSIWLFAAFYFSGELIEDAGPWGWVGLLTFAAYGLADRIVLRPLASAASSRRSARLLLLRVFGFRRRTERFFDLLGVRWRYAGPIQLIAAPDLATRSIDPSKFLDFLSWRLWKRFIVRRADLDHRLAQLDLRPDPDGRFRINEFFCGNDAWQQAVTRLMTESDLVAMDLRSFSPENKGCLFELQALIDTVPVARIVLLVDATTDLAFLRKTLTECWQELKVTSPNQHEAGTLTMLEVGRNDVDAVKALLALADNVLSSPLPTMPRVAGAAVP